MSPPRTRTARSRATQGATLDLREVRLAPVIVIHGAESSVGDRVAAKVRQLARTDSPGVELTQLTPAEYRPGLLNMLTAPSLFEEPRLVVVDGVDQANESLVEEILVYWQAPAPDVTLVLRHRGGQRNRQILTRATEFGAPVYRATKPKNAGELVNLVQEEAREQKGSFGTAAAQALVDAIGTDVDEILGATRQLLADNAGNVDAATVDAHFAGKADAGGFKIADALAGGHGPEALVLARRAFASNEQANREPVVIVAALARKFRDLAKVTAPGLGSKDLGMPPWLANKARDQAKKWSQEAIGRSISLVARADEDVKGASRDPHGAVEKCIIEISRVFAQQRPGPTGRR